MEKPKASQTDTPKHPHHPHRLFVSSMYAYGSEFWNREAIPVTMGIGSFHKEKRKSEKLLVKNIAILYMTSCLGREPIRLRR